MLIICGDAHALCNFSIPLKSIFHERRNCLMRAVGIKAYNRSRDA